ncbi:MAG: hypothetical protein AAGK17_10750 [Pseudomonadota bacterium]
MLSVLASLALALQPGTNEYRCALEPEKLLSWKDWSEVEPPEIVPFKTVYEGCGKTVIFVAVEHSNDPASKTYALIEQALVSGQPDIVILEGFPSDFGTSPSDMVAYADSVAGTAGDFEPMYAVRIADKGNISFIGGEPSDQTILEMIAPLEISPADLFGFYVLRQIDQWLLSGEIESHKDPMIAKLISSFKDEFLASTGASPETIRAVSDFDGFKVWYATQNGLGYNEGYSAQDSWPTSPDTNRKTNQLSDLVSDIRDLHLQKTMADALNKHDTVVVIYGFSHHVIHKPALESAFPAN